MSSVTSDWRWAWPVILSALLAALPVHAAPVPPDAGQMMRELQKQPEPLPPASLPPLKIEGETATGIASADSMRIALKAIRFNGNTVFSTAQLEALVTDLPGGERTLAELDAAAARITAHYRRHGFPLARAYLPPQDIVDGVVTIKVQEGRIGEKRPTNRSRLSDARIAEYLSPVRSGDVLQAEPVDRALLLLGDVPGVGAVRASLQPGASVGTSDLLIEVDPAAAYNATVELDNHGNFYTGEYRADAMLALNSPFAMGEQIILRALTSDQSMSFARISSWLPVGGSGLKLGMAYSEMSYRLGRDFTFLQFHGMAISSSVYATYPVIRGQTGNLTGTLIREVKKLENRIDATPISLGKQVQLTSLGLIGNHQDSWGGGGRTSFDLSLASGRLEMDIVSRFIDFWSARSQGAFTRATYSLSRLQYVTNHDTLSLAFSGQQASKNLNSSEKFSLGGVYGVRAYPQGEGSGDEGWQANLELRHRFTDRLQGMLFYDTGRVSVNRYAYTAGANHIGLSGAGLGASASLGILQMKAYLAWRTGSAQPTSEPVWLNRNPRLWLQMSGQFK